MDLNQFVDRVKSIIAREDGNLLLAQLALPREIGGGPYKNILARAKTLNMLSYCVSHIPDIPLANVIGNNLLCLHSLAVCIYFFHCCSLSFETLI